MVLLAALNCCTCRLWPCLAVIALSFQLVAVAEETPIKVPTEGGQVTLSFPNTIGLSQVLDLNDRGQLLGMREVPLANIGLEQETFFYDDSGPHVVPKLEDFTNVQPESISNTGRVVGYVSREIGHPEGSLLGFVWDAPDGELQGLAALPDYHASHATDIAADGRRVVGYSTGRNPPRMTPCLWEEADGKWTCTPLETIHAYNPYLLTSRIVINDGGTKIAACITVRMTPGDLTHYDSSLFLWSRQADGNWNRELVSDNQAKLSDINDRGDIVGSIRSGSRRQAFVATARKEFRLLDHLEGDDHSEAMDINNTGTICGYSDDPRGPEGGPTAVTWNVQDGTEASRLPLFENVVFSAAQAVNERGQIAGYAVVARPPESDVQEAVSEEGTTYSFTWTPEK